MADLKESWTRSTHAVRATCPLVFACDEGYGMPLATTLRSIVETNADSWPLEFHVLSDGISEGMRTKIINSLPVGSASMHWATVELGLFSKFSTLPHISKITYARLLIPRFLPDTVAKVLYLDADLLVLRSLDPLWEMDLEGAIVGAVSDAFWGPVLKRGGPECKNMPRVRDYFNAGVLLIDLNRWRENRVSEKALEYLAQHPQSPFSDQDALNVACNDLWKALDPRWNYQNHRDYRIADVRPDQRPWIVHFVRTTKPWIASARSYNAPFYDAFRSRTRFARTRVEKLMDLFRSNWAGLKNVWRRRGFLRTWTV